MKPNHALYVFTDASNVLWPGVVTQTKPEELNKPIEDRHKCPLALLGPELNKSELNWKNV